MKIEPWQFRRAWSAGLRCGDGDKIEVINRKPTGVVRASLGAMSTIRDVDTFLEFLSKTFIETPVGVTKLIEADQGHFHFTRKFLGSQDSGIGSFVDGNSDGHAPTQPTRFAIPSLRSSRRANNQDGSEMKHLGCQALEKSRDSTMITMRTGELRVAIDAEEHPPQEHRGRAARLKTSFQNLRKGLRG